MSRVLAMPGRDSLVLAIDSATDFPSFAAGTPAAPGDDVRLDDRRALSRDIEAVVASLLASGGRRPADLTAVLVADGPGSFTGLRIGAAFAKGVCRALRVPLLTAPSLLGAATRAARTSGRALPIDVEVRYDALRGECFRAVYRVGDDAVSALVPAALASAATALGESEGGRLVAASGSDASAAALLGLVGLPGGPLVVPDPGGWEPAYGRPAEAEARRLAGSGERAGS